MGVNGKAKGSQFERTIANMLSARFADKTGITSSFRRNPDSGSFFGGSNKKRTETHDLDNAFFGDLICPDAFRFSVECKFYKTGPSFASIVKGKITQWDEWIAQAAQDASSSGKEMLLIIKYNGVDEICVLDHKILDTHIDEAVRYKNFFIYRLKDMLQLSDTLFFN